mmetsp:Transcript_19409/g.42186  ORF Transcript_19409/g.42186 Transcript_19409/m.42186 type:complete len:301 (+) Transcript_19409:146-1048(+)|eukprot:CAMPEP_0168179858 /NCGR_PEP_ID=MMETSP0139_2-20121125/10118_1 /TAXON_ID=44445 /ORGANISM="Pseudo-nitzschia australis, Strain 10249 10 AB" /LENGTH=300 /DNA_ID=CAMNT_0008099817 /DNA_START=105 /DNA_END=1007 /DNA_ORIENTATION=+
MSRKEFPSNRRAVARDTLDLHGYNKSEGVRRTTEFLDRTRTRNKNVEKAWVLIITGSGAHSSDGPVLRGAIESILVKRKIEYHVMKGKGSLLVNAASGFVLYDPAQPTDSKVIVTQALSSDLSSSIQFPTLKKRFSESTERSRNELKRSFYNRYNEKAAFDKALSESESLDRMNTADEEDEKKVLERVLSLSLLEEQKAKEQEEKLREAIEFSKQESIMQSMDEQEQIRKATELSNIEFEYQNDPDSCFQRAIELSRKGCEDIDVEMLMMLDESARKHRREQQECEAEFVLAMELSVAEF